jgi:hypothetical protein
MNPVGNKKEYCTPEFEARMVAEYQAGTFIRALAEANGYSYSGMHHLLLRNGCNFRTRGNQKKRRGQYGRRKTSLA